MSIHRAIFLIVAFCFSTPASISSLLAQDLLPIEFNETLRTDVPVSGNTLAGISIKGSLPKYGDLKLYTFAPAREQLLCVSVKSVDGRYLSTSQYKASLEKPQWISLQFPSKYTRDIKKYDDNEIAVLVSSRNTGGDCLSRKSNLVTSWTNPEELDNHQINIFLNSGRIKTYLRQAASKNKPLSCTEITSTKLVTYDTVCNIELKDFFSGEWTVIKRRMGKTLPPFKFSLHASPLNKE